jgi:type III pantothenate kinase
MILLGDIGNTESKICLVNSKNKIIKKFNFTTKNINYLLLKKFL